MRRKIVHTSMAVSNLYNECFTSLELDNRIYDEHRSNFNILMLARIFGTNIKRFRIKESKILVEDRNMNHSDCLSIWARVI